MKRTYSLFILMIAFIPVFSQSIVNPDVERMDYNACEVTKIEVTDQYTVISFEHKGSGKDSWVTLYDGIYLQSTTDDSRYPFIKAEGIPLKPAKYYYKAEGEKLAFKVYFKKLEPQVKSIDIIERAGATNYFNFYGVSLEHTRPQMARTALFIDKPKPRSEESVFPSGWINSLVPVYNHLIKNALDAQSQYYQQPGKVDEMAKLTRSYYTALLKEGFTADQAMKIITANSLLPKMATEE